MATAGNLIDITANIDIPTATAQEKGLMIVGGKPVYFTKKKVRSAMALYGAILKAGMPRGFQQFTGPVRMTIEFQFAYPSSVPKKQRGFPIPKVTRPDLDNMAKVLLDSATKAKVWEDDSQVTTLILSKCYSSAEKVRIRIENEQSAEAEDKEKNHD